MAASDRDKNRTELRKEIKIAIYWRQLIGDFEYVKFNPDDMLRWYLAMDLRGADEIRDLVKERYENEARRATVLGVVGQAPHPPVWLVREWLNTRQPKFPIWRIFSVSASLVVVVGILAPTVNGCQGLKTMNPLAYNPPNHQPVMAQAGSNYTVSVVQAVAPVSIPSFTFAPGPASVLGHGESPPVSKAQMGMSPPAGVTSSGNTGPVNVGVSGSSISSTGTTGPTNSGLSGSAPPQ